MKDKPVFYTLAAAQLPKKFSLWPGVEKLSDH
jgi:hypothetical protein